MVVDAHLDRLGHTYGSSFVFDEEETEIVLKAFEYYLKSDASLKEKSTVVEAIHSYKESLKETTADYRALMEEDKINERSNNKR